MKDRFVLTDYPKIAFKIEVGFLLLRLNNPRSPEG